MPLKLHRPSLLQFTSHLHPSSQSSPIEPQAQFLHNFPAIPVTHQQPPPYPMMCPLSHPFDTPMDIRHFPTWSPPTDSKSTEQVSSDGVTCSSASMSQFCPAQLAPHILQSAPTHPSTHRHCSSDEHHPFPLHVSMTLHLFPHPFPKNPVAHWSQASSAMETWHTQSLTLLHQPASPHVVLQSQWDSHS